MLEQVTAIIKDLQILEAKLTTMTDLDDRISRAQAHLTSVTSQLKTNQDLLKKGIGELAAARDAEKKAHEADLYAKQGELRDLHDMIAKSKEELAVVQRDIVDAQKKHEDLIKVNRGIEKQFA